MSKPLSYTCGVSTEPLLGKTIGDAFDDIVEQFPTNEAVVSSHQGIRLSYSELQVKVNQCAKSFIALGLMKAERLGIWSPNCVEWLVAQIASAKTGIILVNINPSYRLSELEYALNQSGCKIIIIADRFKYSDYTQMTYDVAPEIKTSGGNPVACKKVPALERVVSLASDPQEGMMMWDELMALGTNVSDKDLAKRQNSLTFDDPINIQYTSGTTGFPKGATLSHHNILNNGNLVAKMQRFTDKDRLVIPVPLYHCFGMVMGNLGCLSHGATIIYPGDSFDPLKVLEAVEAEKATSLYGVPTMFYAELNHEAFGRFDLTSLRTGVMAGATCPPDLMKRINSDMHIGDMLIAYGMTETSPVSTQTRHDAPFVKRVTTVGRVMPHTEIKIIDPETQQVVPIGAKGELCTRGYCVMLGYWNDPEKTAEDIDASRWMHTGDLATMDEDGYIAIVGRIKDMIIRGGENVYPREIEEFLSAHPDIDTVQVIGIPDEKYGEEICAWIQLSEGVKVTEDDIKAYCKGQITHFKIPRYIRFVTEFPMTVTGKVRKVEMKKVMIEEMMND
ncbi:MAG: AMP-binding protein [Bacteroidetes bacterium]|nr:AMP-binding protein [Bacteroidota bacterium]